MKHVKIDQEDERVKQFLRKLPLRPDGVAVELDGRVICKIIDPQWLTDADRDAILAAGWEQVEKARARNKGVPARVIEREVRQAVDEVRRRGQP